MIITAAEQQTMNFYMNVTNLAKTDLARKLYMEIAQVEEEHVTQYESLMDSGATWLEMLLWHEYCHVPHNKVRHDHYNKQGTASVQYRDNILQIRYWGR